MIPAENIAPGLLQQAEGAGQNAFEKPVDSTRRFRLSPRQQRLINALLAAGATGITREQADEVAGASNSPDVVARLRRKLGAAAIDTAFRETTDRDGRPTRPGVYVLTAIGRARLAELTGASRERG